MTFVPLLVGMVPALTELFTQLDARLPNGDYRIPSIVAHPNGTLLAFVRGRMHRTDATPNIILLRRSFDDGETWAEARPILDDPANQTMFRGAPVVHASGAITFVHNQVVFGTSGYGCCVLWGTTTSDAGATWSTPAPLNTTGAVNATWGDPLASGVRLTSGAHAGRLVVALRRDCGGGLPRASFVVYSDDDGATWQGGEKLVLIPLYGGGWTECEAAELQNGSVILTSRNYYGSSSGYGPRLFARSDSGGTSWAANWSAGDDLPDPYCEGSILAAPSSGKLVFGNPSNVGRRLNFSVHASDDGGRTWPRATVVFPGDAGYSDMAFTRNGSVAVLFEKGFGGNPSTSIAFGVVPVPE